MRVLTDPMEIRAFRKKQARKILRMMKADIQRFAVRCWCTARNALVEVSICSAFLALWFLALVVMVGCGGWVLNHCTIIG